MRTRVGFGYDSHVFGADRPLRLAGVDIEHPSGLVGHSDGDVVSHAIIDALLGAAAMGDIGRLFPDTDSQWKDADSIGMLKEVNRRLVAANYLVINIDVTIVAEAPKISPHATAMRDAIAAAIGLPIGAVSIKATTNEKMDAVGRGEGIMVYAVASVADG